MPRNAEQLRTDALAIWQAAVDAVRADRLVAENVRVENDVLQIGDDELPLDKIRRIVVVGAGKAGAGMAAGLEAALGETVARDKQLTGWINVPADCVNELLTVRLPVPLIVPPERFSAEVVSAALVVSAPPETNRVSLIDEAFESVRLSPATASFSLPPTVTLFAACAPTPARTVTVNAPAERLICTSSVDSGARPRLQFDPTSQKPLLSTFQNSLGVTSEST